MKAHKQASQAGKVVAATAEKEARVFIATTPIEYIRAGERLMQEQKQEDQGKQGKK
jgi:hypothetical protein